MPARRAFTEEDVVLVYGRESNDPEDLRISVDRQLKTGRKYAAEHWPGATVLTFRDDDITAAKAGVTRPGFEDLLHELRRRPKGSVVGIWANEQSRLTRLGEASWEDLRVIFNMAGLSEVHTGVQGIIGIEPGNSLAGRLYAVIDSEFAERTRVKVREAHADLFTEGRPSGRAPFGYRSTKDDRGRPALEEDPTEGPVVRKVFDMALAGHAISVIADWLNAEGIAPRAAGWKLKDGRQVARWKPGSVREVLSSPSVAGLRGHTDEDGQLHTTPARWGALIEVDQWRQVQRVLGQPTVVTGSNGETYRVRTKPTPQPRRYLLSGGRKRSGIEGQPGDLYGVLRCGKCGRPLVAQTQQRRERDEHGHQRRVPAYACHPKSDTEAEKKEGKGACGGVSISPADELEALVVAAIQRRLATSRKLRQLLNASQDSEVGRWRAERDAAKAVMLDASSLYGSRHIDRDAFDAMYGPAKRDHDAAEARLASIATDTVLPSADDVTQRWEHLTLKQQRAVVERLIARIEVAPSAGGYSGFDPGRVGEPEWLA